MSNKKEENYISLREASQRYDYTRDHLGYLIRKGDLNGKKFGSFYFTKSSWIQDYLENSSKARKKITKKSHQNSDTQQEKKPLQQQSRPQIKKKKKSYKFLQSFKQEIYPLLRDVYMLLKNIKGINDKLISNLKKYFQAITTIYLALQKDLQSWFVEIKYFFNSIKKRINNSQFLQNFIVKLRKINYVPAYLSFSNKPKKKRILFSKISSFKQLKQKLTLNAQRFKNAFKHQLTNTLWYLSFKKPSRKHHLPRFSSYFFVKQLIGSSLILLGLIMISGSGYLMLDNSDRNLNLQNKVIDSFNRLSHLVYVRLDKVNITFLSNVGDDIDWIGDQGNRALSQYYATKNRIQEEAILKNLILNIQKTTQTGFQISQKHLASLFFNKYSALNTNLTELKKDFQFVYLDFKIFQTNARHKFATFQDYSQESLKNILAFTNIFHQKLFIAQQAAKQRIGLWQSYNNQFLAELDNEFFLAKQRAFQGIAQGSQHQLAQLKDYLRFVKEPFYRAKRTLAGWFGSSGQLQELENKIAKIEKAQKEETLSLSQTKDGLVVVPSQGDDEATKRKIRQSFSDEVTIEPDETGRSGIIRPVFREPTQQKYLYLLVPMMEK